jgi:hypothetical protein
MILKEAKIPDKIFLYNPTSKIVKLTDLGVEIDPSDTIDLRKKNPRMDADSWHFAVTGGKLAEQIKSGKLILSYEDRRFSEDNQDYFEASKKPFVRRGLTVVPRKAKQSDFIEKLQSEFDGESILSASEGKIAKNTSKLIDTIDFDGFDDPLKEE